MVITSSHTRSWTNLSQPPKVLLLCEALLVQQKLEGFVGLGRTTMVNHTFLTCPTASITQIPWSLSFFLINLAYFWLTKIKALPSAWASILQHFTGIESLCIQSTILPTSYLDFQLALCNLLLLTSSENSLISLTMLQHPSFLTKKVRSWIPGWRTTQLLVVKYSFVANHQQHSNLVQ